MKVPDGRPDSDTSAQAKREEERFARLHRELYPRVVAYAMRRTMDTTAADEIAAEALEIAWRRRDEPVRDHLSWILGISRNLLANRRRSERRQAELDRRLASEWLRHAPDPAHEVSERSELLAGLSRLSELDRELLILLGWDQLDRDQAARVLGCSRATLAVRLHRARRRLEAALQASDETQRVSEPMEQRS